VTILQRILKKFVLGLIAKEKQGHLDEKGSWPLPLRIKVK